MKIKLKIWISLVAIAVAVLSGGAITYMETSKERAAITTAQSEFERVSAKYLPLVVLSKQIELNIVQVQQYFQDISATRGLDGLDEGPKLAQEQADDFQKNIAEAKTIARSLSLKDLEQLLDRIRAGFSPYFDAGEKMSKVYVEQGPEAGNQLMEDFDDVASSLAADVNRMRELASDAASASMETAKATLQQVSGTAVLLSTIALAVTIITLSICAVVGFVVARSVLRPLSAATTAMLGLADGDLSVEIPSQDSKDEIGDMAKATLVFKNNIQESDQLRIQNEEVQKAAQIRRKQEMQQLADEFETRVGEVVKAISAASMQLQSTAEAMSTASTRAGQRAEAASGEAQEASNNASAVAAATEELSASFSEINRQTANSLRIISEAVTETGNASQKVEELRQVANKISDVVELINDVAEQTNLLALNATIEAARAGEAGKGFAVVAGEVKSLAVQTGKATDEVKAQISAIQRAVQQSTGAMTKISSSITEANEISTTIAGAVEEQTAATNEISSRVGDASRNSEEIKLNIGSVLEATEETGSAASQVLAAAAELSRNSEHLSTSIDAFLREIRADA